MSLLKLPAEVQKNILMSLDYASLCQIRSTGRYFYNFLTEPEIHDVFLNINIPQGDYQRNPKDGQTCFYCAGFCDATAAQEKATKRKLKLAQKQVESADEKAMAAKQDVLVAEKALMKAKAAVKATKVQKEKKEKRAKVLEAQEHVKSAKEAVKAADLDLVSAQRTKHGVPQSSPDLVKTCHACERKFNGYSVPGLLNNGALTIQSVHWGLTMACSRVSHYIRRRGPAYNLEVMQKDGKICKICWKSGRREVSSIQRRRTFIDEFGYWLRVDWLMQAEVFETKGKMLAEKSFEDIEKEKKEADAAKAHLKVKMEENDENN
jgi:hypothetical protein